MWGGVPSSAVWQLKKNRPQGGGHKKGIGKEKDGRHEVRKGPNLACLVDGSLGGGGRRGYQERYRREISRKIKTSAVDPGCSAKTTEPTLSPLR